MKDTPRAELPLSDQPKGKEELWGSMLSIPALGTWRQEDQESKDTLHYIASQRPAWDTQTLSQSKMDANKSKIKMSKDKIKKAQKVQRNYCHK